MEGDYKIVCVEKPDEAVWGAVGGGIYDYNTQQAGKSNEKRLCFVLYAPDGEIVGGVIGLTYWEWFYIDLLWVKDDLRGRGHGHRLLALAEEEARQRGAKNAYLDTFSFQAPAFYTKNGYQVFGELTNFPPPHTWYFLRKEL